MVHKLATLQLLVGEKQSMWRSWNVPRIALLVAMGAATALSGDTLVAQTDYQRSPENLQARREFQDAKFGMFIHWSVYSVLGAGEWVFHERKLIQFAAAFFRSRCQNVRGSRKNSRHEVHHDYFPAS